MDDPGTLARCRFLARLGELIAESRESQHRLALFLVGVDRRRIEPGGDDPSSEGALLARAGERLASCVGEANTARLQPKTFGMLLPSLRSGLQAREVATRVVGTLGLPFRPRVGIAIFPSDGDDTVALLVRASTALERARREDRPTYCFYLPAFATSAASSPPLL
jgi:two-component system CheB/CheR fusion protein